MGLIEPSADGMHLRVKVVPGASRTKVSGLIGDRVKVTVAAPPEKGKANAALERLLAKLCGLRPRDVAVVVGQTSAAKTVLLRGVSAATIRAALDLP